MHDPSARCAPDHCSEYGAGRGALSRGKRVGPLRTGPSCGVDQCRVRAVVDVSTCLQLPEVDATLEDPSNRGWLPCAAPVPRRDALFGETIGELLDARPFRALVKQPRYDRGEYRVRFKLAVATTAVSNGSRAGASPPLNRLPLRVHPRASDPVEFPLGHRQHDLQH